MREVNVKVDHLGRLKAVDDLYAVDIGDGLGMFGEMAEEGSNGEEDSGVVFLNCLVLFNTEDACVNGFVNGIRLHVAF